MTASLKSCIPALAAALNETPGALYERQRALVQEGLLESAPGRGPGSGVKATPVAVGLLLISILASVAWSGSGTKTRAVALAEVRRKCGLTGSKTFFEALSVIIADENVAKRVNSVTVCASQGYAIIAYDGQGQKKLAVPGFEMQRLPSKSYFGSTKAASVGDDLRIEITIGAQRIQAIAAIVANLEKRT
jgi:hypothetical protein